MESSDLGASFISSTLCSAVKQEGCIDWLVPYIERSAPMAKNKNMVFKMMIVIIFDLFFMI
jgi:hypothetical protein